MGTETLERRFPDASPWVLTRPLQAALGLSLGLHLGTLLGLPGWHQPTAAAPAMPALLHAILRVPEAPPTAPTPAPQAAVIVVAPMPARAVSAPSSPEIQRSEARLQQAPRKIRRDLAPGSQAAARPETSSAMLQPATRPDMVSERQPANSPAVLAQPAAPDRLAQVHAAPAPAQAVKPEPTPTMLAAYGETLEKLLSRQQQYPRLAAVRGWGGEVVMRIVLARKGKLVAVRMVRSSGHEMHDRNAAALVAAFEPYPPPPTGTLDADLEITVPIRYRLGQSS